jgi:hypothetical protein
MSKQLTVRGVPDEISKRRQSLARYTTWTQEDLEVFNEALAAQRTKDDPLRCGRELDNLPLLDRTVL